MAVSITKLLDAEDQTNATESSYVSSSIDPTNDTLTCVAVLIQSDSSAWTGSPTLSGGGMDSWSLQASVAGQFGSQVELQAYLFRSVDASAGSGTLTFTAPGSETFVRISLSAWEFPGAVISGTNGADAFVQQKLLFQATGVAAATTVTFDAAFADAGNAGFAVFGMYLLPSAQASTPRSGWTEHEDEWGGASQDMQQAVHFRADEDSAAVATYGTSGYNRNGMAFEIAAAGADTTAPVLTSASGTATGETTADLSVDSDEDCDAYVVVTESSTTPTHAQILAGQDHTGAAAAYDEDALGESAGTINFAGATGLAPATTYWAHFTAEDAADNESTPITSSSFTTDTPPASISTLVDGFDTEIAAAVWDEITAEDSTVTWNAGKVDLAAEVTTSEAYALIITDADYELDDGGSISIEVTNFVADSAAGFLVFRLEAAGGSAVEVDIEGDGGITGILDDVPAAETGQVIFTTTYSPTAHRWLRIRRVTTTIFVDASANGVNWNNLGSLAPTTSPATLFAAVKAKPMAYTAGSVGDSIQATIDNVNVGPVLGAGLPAGVVTEEMFQRNDGFIVPFHAHAGVVRVH